MKHWSLTTTAYFLWAATLAGVQAVDESTSKLRSPQCVTDLQRAQVNMLQHFNGIFGEFIIKDNEQAQNGSIYGPIAALNITSNGFGYNSQAKMNCKSKNRILRAGLISKNTNVQGDIYGDIWSETGDIDTKSNVESLSCGAATSLRVLNPTEDLVQSLYSFAPTVIRHVSKKLAEYRTDAVIEDLASGLQRLNIESSLDNYYILRLPACSDRGCAADTIIETHPSVLRGGNEWTGSYGSNIPADKMIVFNIPVYVGGTYTISTQDVNKNLSPCQTVFNFFAVDQRGQLVSDPNASFTLIRAPGVTIAGTILAPQARIIDSSTGHFGGQLITLNSYQGSGADIKDFESVSNGQCSSRSLCWPIVKNPVVVTQVVTVSNTQTQVSTVNGKQAAAVQTPIENRFVAPVAQQHPTATTIVETVTVMRSASHTSSVRPKFGDMEPVEFYHEDALPTDACTEEDCDETLETVKETRLKIVTETTQKPYTFTRYRQNEASPTVVVSKTLPGVHVSFSTSVSLSTYTPADIGLIQDAEFTVDGEGIEDSQCEILSLHRQANRFEEIISCYWNAPQDSSVCVTHIREEFESAAPFE